MNTPQPSSAPNVSRGVGFVLGLVVFTCMVMIAATGYVKWQLDRAQNILSAPASAFVQDQEVFDKLRRALGYSGFVGFAQNFAVTHDPNNLPDMRAQMKQANDMVARLPEKTPPEMRHDLQAILGIFNSALDKAEKESATFLPPDMAPLYAALPVLDSRVDGAVAANRLVAQDRLQFWSMLLTLASWCSLIIASALAAGIYLTLRSRNSAPLRALSQSVRNMARGDMRTSIWGMERTDMVGELARAMDLARYHFSQLPDMSLLSEQGPVRLRFEGNTRSLFEAMMRVISRDSETVRTQASALTDAVVKQQEAIALISSRVEAVLHNVEKRGLEGDAQARAALNNIIHSAGSLKTAQEHAADQLNRILPFLQDRAHNIAEITQITGKQVAQVLAALTLSERGIKVSAEQSDVAIKKLSEMADNLGERMFGAVNLLQASGKVLAETTEKTQSRLNEVIDSINAGHVPLANAPAAAPMPDIMPRLDAIAAALEMAHKKLDERPTEIVAAPAPQGENVVLDVSPRLEAVAAALESAQKHLDAQLQEVLSHSAARAGESATPGNSSAITEQIREQWYQMAGQIEASRSAIEQAVTQQIDRIEGKLTGGAATASSEPGTMVVSAQQMEEQGQILSELVATLGVLDAHMQQLMREIGQSRQTIPQSKAS